MIVALPDVVFASPLSFLVGVLVGFWLTSFWTITRRNGGDRGGRP